MKIINESISKYVHDLQSAIRDESETINLYEMMIKEDSLSPNALAIIEEILNDEKDHLVLLTALLNEQVEEDFPNNGDDEDLLPEEGSDILSLDTEEEEGD